MKERKFWLIALVLVMCGIFAQAASLGCSVGSLRLTRKSLEVGANRAKINAERRIINRRGEALALTGMICVVPSLLFSFLSYRTREPARGAVRGSLRP